MTDSGNQKPEKKKKGGWIPHLIGCGGLVLLSLVVGGVLLYAGWLGYHNEAVDASLLDVRLEAGR
jgi:hypothetical protein